MKRLLLKIFFALTFCLNAFAVSNSNIEAVVAQSDSGTFGDISRKCRGRFTAGIPPASKLLYGYPSAIWSSYTTIKVDSPGNTLAVFGNPSGTWIEPPADTTGNTQNNAVWGILGFVIRQQLTLVENPRGSTEKDTIEIRYIIRNDNASVATAGIRIMLDLQLGGNDNSPVNAQGSGKIVNETRWLGAAVPEAYRSFDDYVNPSVSAEGILKLGAATPPDMLIIGQWTSMKEDANRWDYTLSGSPITDSAAAVFFNPVSYLPGQAREYVTYYGIPKNSGAALDIKKDVNVPTANYGDILSYSITYSNVGTLTAGGLTIWDSIPWNTSLIDYSPGAVVSGGVISWYIGSLINGSAPANVWYRVAITPVLGTSVNNTAIADYTDPYWSEREVVRSNQAITGIFTATATASPTASPTPTITETPEPKLELTDVRVFPNPAEKDANIIFNINTAADIKVIIFTVSGEKTREIKGYFQKGYNSVRWNLKNDSSRPVASGVFVFRIEAVNNKKEKRQAFGKIMVAK